MPTYFDTGKVQISDVEYGDLYLNYENFDLRIVDHETSGFLGLGGKKYKRVRFESPIINHWDFTFIVNKPGLFGIDGLFSLDSVVDLYLRNTYLTLEGLWHVTSEGEPFFEPDVIDLGL